MSITLLGRFAIAGPDGAPLKPPTRKAALALATLAVVGSTGVPRATLAAWVWPDRSESQARTSLRQALSGLRRLLPGGDDGLALMSETDQLQLTGPAWQVDLWRFSALAGSQDGQERLFAAALYQGDLLAGVEAPEPLEMALRPHRDRCRRLAARLVETLSEAVATGAASSEATALETAALETAALAERLLAADPADEAAHRALMRLALARGEPNAARRAYAACEAAVRQVLDAAPEATTRALLDAPMALAANPVATSVPAPTRTPPKAAPPATPWEEPRPSVAVMPFDDLGGEGDVFADGVVEEITAALSRIRDFFVIARQSAYAYKDRFVDVRAVGRELGVRYVVEGVVRRGGDRVRINVQLVETEGGAQLWSERYEGGRAELFELQDRIAAQVAGALNPSIRASEIERARRAPPENRQAYELVLQAMPHFWSHRREDNAEALRLLGAAIGQDPEYGLALALKAWCHAQQANYLWGPDPSADRQAAQETAEAAARHAGDHATALAAIGATHTMTSPDAALSLSFIERSLALDPNHAWGWMRLGWHRVFFSDGEGAIECLERAMALSPRDPFVFNMKLGTAAAHSALATGPAGTAPTPADHDDHLREAARLTEEALREAPGVTWALRMLASYYARLGDADAAASVCKRLLDVAPDLTIARMRQGLPPSHLARNPEYWEGFRLAGIPEE